MAGTGRGTVRVIRESRPLGFTFFVAFIGATVYFVERASGFWGVVVGILQAVVWPAFVVYHVLLAQHI